MKQKIYDLINNLNGGQALKNYFLLGFIIIVIGGTIFSTIIKNLVAFIQSFIKLSKTIEFYKIKCLFKQLFKELQKQLLILMFIIGCILIKPFKFFLLLLKSIQCFFIFFIKAILSTILNIINVKNSKELLFSLITNTILVSFLLVPFLSIITDTKYRFNSFLEFIFTCGMLLFVGVFILFMFKFEIKENIMYYLFIFFIIMVFFLFIMLMTLAMYEKFKNVGITSNIAVIKLFSVSVYIIGILMIILKKILDRGSIFVSCTTGLFVYFTTLFYISLSMGFFITASYPQYFPKDKIVVSSSNKYLTYLASYSYTGAKYLLAFPNSDDFNTEKPINTESKINTNKDDKSVTNPIPIKIYLVYFMGIIVNVIITAFYISYAVSIYVLKISDEKGYEEYIKNADSINVYLSFLNKKLKDIWNGIRNEHRKIYYNINT
jgi:hypothetical protein